jgi:predicted Fe-Mo cluster-binding NifX family protein
MKIAVPVTADHCVDHHFGHCSYYQIFTLDENNAPIFVETTDAPVGCGCKSNVALQLKQKGVTVLLAGGIGQGAIDKLAENGIRVVRNCTGNATERVLDYVAGTLTDGGETCTAHSGNHSHACNH